MSDMNKHFFTQIRPYLFIIIVFAAIAAIYCSPALEGKIVYASDNIQGRAAVQESIKYTEDTGDATWWNGAMFSGMPNYQIGGGKYLYAKVLKPFYSFLHWGNQNIYFVVLFYFISFFVLLRSFKIDKWLCLAGALAIAMSSYFFIIIAASHNAKCTSITWMTQVLVGFILLYQKKYALGSILTMFFLVMGMTIHPQMAYYICLLIGVLFCAELYIHIKEKRYKDFALATVLFAFSFGIGMGVISANVFANQEYVTQTMRGGHSEIVREGSKEQPEKGLSLDYATAWSYGIDETMTFLIPNYMGAASGYNVGNESVLYEELVKQGVPQNSAAEFSKGAPTYWGTQPFTVGPVYMGAIVCFLFMLGLLIVKGPYKWALLVATLFSVLLSWGHNFMSMTEFFFHYFPMYNKFRAVSSILIIAEITIPLLGFLALKAIADKQVHKEKLNKAIYTSAGITAGLCLFFALLGKGFMSFTSPNDAQFTSQIPDWVYNAIIAQRADMMQSDAWRSFFFIIIGAGLVYLYVNEKIKIVWFGIGLSALILADMWPVNKRFFNDGNFVSTRQRDQAYAMLPYEKELLKDTTDFRVFNMTTNAFNDARTSYYLKSIGGYSAVKLRRYQDLIDEHLSKMNMNVLNMLNTKYIITQAGNGQIRPQLNPNAMGNVWFIDTLLCVATPNDESDALNNIDVRTTAVIDTTKFAELARVFTPNNDSTARINLINYTPGRMDYVSKSTDDGVAVFSEIYYPYGWKASIDGKSVDHYRVNYVLRALPIPAGEHQISFVFEPDSVRKGNIISLICLCIMFAVIIGYTGFGAWKYFKKKKE